jgi:hypothetical protein
MTPTELTLPLIHLNGSGREPLFTDYLNAWEKLRDAVTALEKVEFNARDYYPLGMDAFDKARNERARVFSLLKDAESYLEQHATHLS